MDDTLFWVYNTVLPELRDNLEKQALVPVSHSKISMLLNCPKSYEYAYVSRSPAEDSEGIIDTNVGTFIHEVLERAVPVRLNNIKLGMSYDFDLIWASVLNNKQKRPLTSLEIEKAESMRDNTSAVVESVIDLLTHNKLDPEVECFIGLDKELKSFKKQHYTRTFIHGYIDLLGISPTNDAALILDYKTYSKNNDTDAIVRDQLEIYAILLFMKYPHINRVRAGVAYIPDNTINISIIDRSELRTMVTHYRDKLNRALEVISTEKGIAKPGVHCRWCSFKYLCSPDK